MASDSYDVLILGGGNAGFGVTVPTRKAGMTVAMVEERDLGGTCPIAAAPRKVLVAPATRCTRSAKPSTTSA
jgi:glutathione reductase (NADPH)